MPRRSIRTFAIGSLTLVLLGCGAQPLAPQVAIVPTATPTPIKATATLNPTTATAIVPTATVKPAVPTPVPSLPEPSRSNPPTTLTIVPLGDAEAARPDGLPADWAFYPRTINGVSFGLPAGGKVVRHIVAGEEKDVLLGQVQAMGTECIGSALRDGRDDG